MPRKNIIYILILITLVGLFSPVFQVKAQAGPGACYDMTTDPPTLASNISRENCLGPVDGWSETGAPPASRTTPVDTSYHLLEPIPCDVNANPPIPGCNKDTGRLEFFDPSSQTGEKNTKFGEYLNIIIRLFIGLCAVLAVVMIVVGGIEYATSELISTKEAGKERIRGAILGLLLALGAYTILFTINPDLLKTDVDIADVGLDVNQHTLRILSNPPNSTPPVPTKGEQAVGACAKLLDSDIIKGFNTVLHNEPLNPNDTITTKDQEIQNLEDNATGHSSINAPPAAAVDLRFGTNATSACLAAKKSIPIYAPFAGKVVQNKQVRNRPGSGSYIRITSNISKESYGCTTGTRCVIIAHINSQVKLDDYVEAGQQIGTATSWCNGIENAPCNNPDKPCLNTGPHIHFELKLDGKWVTGDGKGGVWEAARAALEACKTGR